MNKFLLLIFLSLCLVAKASTPNTPWSYFEKNPLPPSIPDQDYTPVVIPNGCRAPYKIVDGVKVFHLIAEPIIWEVAEGLTIQTWGYNGSVPGPLIEVAEGDRVRIYVTNHLPEPTSVHWHGVLVPCGMDGVAGLTQIAIPVNETYVYEFIFPDAGTFMYHPHHDDMVQEGMGLTGMIVVHKRIKDPKNRPDRDFVIMLHEWNIEVGTARPNTLKSSFNLFTMNGKVFPATEPLVAELGETVWIRFGNLSAIDHHPIHLHGYSFKIIGTDGGWIKDKAFALPETTVLIPTGSSRVVELFANNPGDWIFHCHMTHHTMNQMGHEFPNMIDMKVGDFAKRVDQLIPGYMAMGVKGMRDLTKTGLPIPENSIPMLGYDSVFGKTVLGGMANIFRVRQKTDHYKDPGPYIFPSGTRALPATITDLRKDGININIYHSKKR